MNRTNDESGECVMWGRWKSLFKSIFSTTATREVEKKHQPIKRNSEIKMKMKYQYPTEKAFRFPLIPDEHRSKEKSDIPAFQRRRRVELLQEDHTTNQGRPREKQQIENDYYQKPFKPSQVPSPIYGYHKRSEAKEIDKIPTFIRNHQGDGVESTHSQRLEREVDDRKQKEHSEKKIPEKEKIIKEKNELTNRSEVEKNGAGTRKSSEKSTRMHRVKKQKQL